MNSTEPTTIRPDDLLRHLKDLRTGTYEGVQSRQEKEELYLKGIELLTPVVIAILEEANSLFLGGTGEIQIIGPKVNSAGELETRFELSWPEQQAAFSNHGSHNPLQEADAERQKNILAAIVELELHQHIFETDWRILPISQRLKID